MLERERERTKRNDAASCSRRLGCERKRSSNVNLEKEKGYFG